MTHADTAETFEVSTGPAKPAGAAKRAAAVTAFLGETLSRGAAPVRGLELEARAAGLLGEHQRVTHAKVFKAAKTQLGIRSVRNGFGRGGEWSWQLATLTAQPSTGQTDHLSAAHEPVGDTCAHRVRSEGAAGEPSSVHSSAQTLKPGEDRDPAVLSWVSLIGQLDDSRPPAGIPVLRWATFLTDSHVFLNSPWAHRAARLGWTAADLFGFSPVQPLIQLGRAGLLWVLNGATMVELHRDWVLIDVSGCQRVVNRRRIDERGVVLPWTRRQRIGGAK
jgi:hypothetical protein